MEVEGVYIFAQFMQVIPSVVLTYYVIRCFSCYSLEPHILGKCTPVMQLPDKLNSANACIHSGLRQLALIQERNITPQP